MELLADRRDGAARERPRGGEGRPAVGEGAVQVPTLSLRAVGLWGCHLLVSLGLGFLLCKIKILGGSFSPV